ncbi:daptide biosynthesis intramembrane metalloprotease [uncultured Cellulomonas sp.]|uniref:daptide biosynthesis intramembrane metalloprotease n=1 Tax=uncultured Cellulomonas sp. TaxID=189682 RepID=UPI00263918F3|nr:daptide biosynthesis intramembrane metalloprotease [uncultured Cellulomonas sp.]
MAARAGSPRAATDPALLDRPALAAGVEVIAPGEPGAPWVIRRGAGYLRVGADLGRLAAGLDGHADRATLADRLGPPWSPEAVELAVDRLGSAGLLDDGRTRPAATARRVVFVPPLSVQLTLVRPGRGMQRLARVVPSLADHRTRSVVVAVVALGLLALVMQGGALVEALSTPVPWQSVVLLVLAAGAATTVHEVSHGVALVHEGGRPSRMGWMLFYLMPAMFCDVSDAWRLPRPAQRVRVALAGVLTQAVIGAVSALAAGLPVPGPVRDWLLVFAAGSYAVGLLNLVPLVKLDGYIALMTHLDRPNLRALCIDWARATTAWALLGGGRPVRPAGVPRWGAAFGWASVLFPWYLALTVLGLYVGLLSRTGPLGVAVLVVGAVYLAALVVQGAVRLVAAGRRNGARPGRTAAALTAVAAVVAVGLTTVRLPLAVPGAYVAVDGRLLFAVPEGVGVPRIDPGAPVEVAQAGLVLTRTRATGQVVGPVDGLVDAPAAAFLPVTVTSDVTLPAQAWEVRLDGGRRPDDGAAVVDAGLRPLGQWLYLTYIAAGFE